MVLQRKAVVMWAQTTTDDTSLSSGWRDDTPQEIRALQHTSLNNVHASRFIFCHFFKGLAYSFEDPFRRAYSNFEISFVCLRSLCLLRHIINILTILGSAVCVRTAFYSFQTFFGKRLLLLLALYLFLLLCLSISIPKTFLRFRSCKREILPHAV